MKADSALIRQSSEEKLTYRNLKQPVCLSAIHSSKKHNQTGPEGLFNAFDICCHARLSVFMATVKPVLFLFSATIEISIVPIKSKFHFASHFS